MQEFEYKVVPAPRRGVKAKGLKTSEDRYAHALAELMNSLGAEGWEYQRSDTLPCDERQGLTGRTTVYHTMLVFRRALAAPVEKLQPRRLTAAEAVPVIAAPPPVQPPVQPPATPPPVSTRAEPDATLPAPAPKPAS